MTLFKGKKIIVGITGSIAAYKCAQLVRLLIKNGAEVKVILTSEASAFITPQTLAVLSKNPVVTGFFASDNQTWQSHVELGLWADWMIIAPATANTISKMANGICDNQLLATYLSARCKVLVAPAMDLDMYQHPTVTRNIKQIEKDGCSVIPAEVGELASGLEGEGRMAEPENIVRYLELKLLENKRFIGKTVLVTAGPTFEKIDPVRFIGNFSSGKMGFAIADAFAAEGASVVLITGPSNLHCSDTILRIDVVSADEMLKECMNFSKSADIVVMCAAVADYKPTIIAPHKIKKKTSTLQLELEKTVDILAELGKQKPKKQMLIGFALESENAEANAKEKLLKKNLDAIILNHANKEGEGFGAETNRVAIIPKKGKKIITTLKNKTEIAKDILNFIAG